MSRDLQKPVFIQSMPAYFGHHEHDVPPDLIGAKIVNFGTVDAPELFSGGGLLIRYVPKGSSSSKTIMFEFNELGMWVSKESRFADIAVPNPGSPHG